jgi:diadenosine tetraphosphate (Ap4A) HIT family hydrolase
VVFVVLRVFAAKDVLVTRDRGKVDCWVSSGTKGVSDTSGCRWCQLVKTDEHSLYEEPAFVVLERGVHRTVGYLTLVPRDHVNILADLSTEDMAAVLAGLSHASGLLRREVAASSVEIRAHPHGGRPRHGHLHFHLVPEGSALRPLSEVSDPESSLSWWAESTSR